MRSRTNAPGKAATGGSRARTSWPATTASTQGPSPSSAACATAASRAPTTWRCTWRGTRTELPAPPVHPPPPAPHRSLGKILSYTINSIYIKENENAKLEMYILYIWENREYIVLIPKCLVLVRIWNACCMLGWPRQMPSSQTGSPISARAGRAGCICSVLPKAPPFNVTVFSKQVRWAQEDSWIVCQDFAWHQRSFFFNTR